MGVWDNSEEPPGPALFAARVQKATGAIVDISDDILHPSADISIHMPGRQTELDRVDTGYVELALNNDAGTYTPGYPSAPVSITQDMPLVIRETVGRRSFPLFDGVVNQADAVFNVGQPGDRVAVTAADWPGTQQDDQSRRFISTLGEHILYNGGSALTVYYPCGDSGTGVRSFDSAAPGREPWPIIPIASSGSNLSDDSAVFTFGGANPLRCDDLHQPLMSPQMLGSPAIMVVGWYPQVVFDTPITVGSGEYLTLAWWNTPAATPTYDSQYSIELAAVGTDNILDIRRMQSSETPVGAWRARVKNAGITWDITAFAQSLNYGETLLQSVTIAPSPGSMQFFSGGRQATGTVTGSPPASFSFDTLTISNFVGSFSHVQIYKGSSTDWSYTKHLAQFRQGLDPMCGGLRWQRTDERIATVSQYAGLTTSQLALDRGVAYMPRASLAGKTWAQVAQEAVDTEQGRLLWRDNALRFDNRVNTRYNV